MQFVKKLAAQFYYFTNRGYFGFGYFCCEKFHICMKLMVPSFL